jgi:hypothetical protein
MVRPGSGLVGLGVLWEALAGAGGVGPGLGDLGTGSRSAVAQFLGPVSERVARVRESPRVFRNMARTVVSAARYGRTAHHSW